MNKTGHKSEIGGNLVQMIAIYHYEQFLSDADGQRLKPLDNVKNCRKHLIENSVWTRRFIPSLLW